MCSSISSATDRSQNLNLVANVTWHSSKQHSINVHHNNEHCKAGQSIAAENRAAGTGGRPLCGICKRLK
jgi:hypothetical protein